jgi:DNA-binding NtrC family response regulator
MPEELEANVLLVDDEEKFVEVLAQRMQTRGLKVETSMSGEDAVKHAKDQNLDAIVLDLQMPGMSGLEALKKMKQENPDLQIIILTGHGTVQAGIEAMKEGALDFIEKPVDLSVLLEKIKEAKQKRVLVIQKKHEEHVKEIMQTRSW